MSEIDDLLERLLHETGASRVTLRENLPGAYRFPVTHEVLAPEAGSLRDERSVDLPNQPVVAELLAGRQVVQDDCRRSYDDHAFHRMLDAYGGLAAQIVTPIFDDGELRAIVSLHELKRTRAWTDAEVAAATEAARKIGELL